MNRLLRLALTCLLLAALPLQGYAAAGMLFCGAGTGAGAVVHDHARHAEDGHHEHPARDAAADPADAEGALNLHDAMHGKCSACASCCSAAALPAASSVAATVAPPPAPVVQVAGAEPCRITARLERPPRLRLA